MEIPTNEFIDEIKEKLDVLQDMWIKIKLGGRKCYIRTDSFSGTAKEPDYLSSLTGGEGKGRRNDNSKTSTCFLIRDWRPFCVSSGISSSASSEIHGNFFGNSVDIISMNKERILNLTDYNLLLGIDFYDTYGNMLIPEKRLGNAKGYGVIIASLDISKKIRVKFFIKNNKFKILPTLKKFE